MEQKMAFSADELKGFSVIAQACVNALVNVPGDTVVRDMQSVAHALGSSALDDIEATGDLEQRYYDRFFVSTSAAFVPLFEDSVRGGLSGEGRFCYGSVNGRFFDHTRRCYEAIGFDYKLIGGFDLAVQRLKPDSFASELAFLAFLAQSAADAQASDAAVATRSMELFAEFAQNHPLKWFDQATECLKLYEDDFYARVCTIASAAVKAMIVE